MSEREPSYVLLVRPKGVGPSWWPKRAAGLAVDRDACPSGIGPTVGWLIEYAWNTITEGGGFTNGFDPPSAVRGDEELGHRVEDWFEAHEDDPWPWEFCQVRLPD